MIKSITIKLQFLTNEAFGLTDTEQHVECARILREYADKLENGNTDNVRLRDINGNAAGDVIVK